MLAVTQWLADTELQGSAERYLGANHPAASQLFAIDFMPPGDCPTGAASTPFCREFPQWDPKLPERAYGVTATQVGPDASATIPLRTMYFRGFGESRAH
jgi:hypothetical protein